MEKEREYFEREVLDLVAALLREYSAPLESVGLQSSVSPLERTTGADGSYSSEVKIYFSDSRGIVDAIEFHTFRNNNKVATLAETEAWLRGTLEDVLARRKTKT